MRARFAGSGADYIRKMREDAPHRLVKVVPRQLRDLLGTADGRTHRARVARYERAPLRGLLTPFSEQVNPFCSNTRFRPPAPTARCRGTPETVPYGGAGSSCSEERTAKSAAPRGDARHHPSCRGMRTVRAGGTARTAASSSGTDRDAREAEQIPRNRHLAQERKRHTYQTACVLDPVTFHLLVCRGRWESQTAR